MRKHGPLEVTRLRALVTKHGNQVTTAKALGIAPSYLSDLLNGRRQCSDAILSKLGLQRVVVEGR